MLVPKAYLCNVFSCASGCRAAGLLAANPLAGVAGLQPGLLGAVGLPGLAGAAGLLPGLTAGVMPGLAPAGPAIIGTPSVFLLLKNMFNSAEVICCWVSEPWLPLKQLLCFGFLQCWRCIEMFALITCFSCDVSS